MWNLYPVCHLAQLSIRASNAHLHAHLQVPGPMVNCCVGDVLDARHTNKCASAATGGCSTAPVHLLRLCVSAGGMHRPLHGSTHAPKMTQGQRSQGAE